MRRVRCLPAATVPVMAAMVAMMVTMMVAMMVAMMVTVMAAPTHLLSTGAREIILIRDGGLRSHIGLGLRAVHQIMLRGQHRRGAGN